MSFLVQAHSGPFVPKVDRWHGGGMVGGKFRPGFTHRFDALPESVRQQFLAAGCVHYSLVGGQFCLGVFDSFHHHRIIDRVPGFNGRVTIRKQGRFNYRVKDPAGNAGANGAVMYPVQAPVGALAVAHGALAAATPHDSFEEMGGTTGSLRGGMVMLCGLPKLSVHEGPVGFRVVPITNGDFSKVHPVGHNLAGGGRANVEHPSYLPPRLAGGTGTKRSPDLGCVITEPEPPVWPFDVTTGGAAHRPDAKPYRPRFSFRDLVGVTFPLHRREGQEHVAGHSAFGGGGVNVFRDGDNLAAGGFDAFDHGECAGHAHATQPVELGDDQSFGFTRFDLTDRPVQDWSGGAAAGHVELGGQHFNLEPSGVSELADSGLLKFGGDEVFPAAYTGHAGVSEPHAVHFSVPRLRGHRELSASVNGLRSVTGVVS